MRYNNIPTCSNSPYIAWRCGHPRYGSLITSCETVARSNRETRDAFCVLGIATEPSLKKSSPGSQAPKAPLTRKKKASRETGPVLEGPHACRSSALQAPLRSPSNADRFPEAASEASINWVIAPHSDHACAGAPADKCETGQWHRRSRRSIHSPAVPGGPMSFGRVRRWVRRHSPTPRGLIGMCGGWLHRQDVLKRPCSPDSDLRPSYGVV